MIMNLINTLSGNACGENDFIYDNINGMFSNVKLYVSSGTCYVICQTV